ncbi:DUF2270 domain-containing protein [Halorubellus sp. JP-L1]|uniref:DUF2270 domain-containing protein n=1 Tax=Halorubellus sp. JP-L1 TaxID=2715753 RepID=UPI00140C56EE|nr:DUF2270 domain-containing protein [Halorubellus sp. JP-L1]
MSDDGRAAATESGDESADATDVPVDDLLSGLGDDPSTVASLVGDLYRGEMDRAATWRARLDQTTNWGVVVAVAILTWVFSNPDNPHYVLLIGMFATATFLLVEAHRFREYDVWRTRVRALQETVFYALFADDSSGDGDWEETMREMLAEPAYTMSFWQAVAHRLRRVYLGLGALLLVSWIVRVTVYQPGRPLADAASIPGVSGTLIFAVVVACYALAVVVALLPLAYESGTTFRG